MAAPGDLRYYLECKRMKREITLKWAKVFTLSKVSLWHYFCRLAYGVSASLKAQTCFFVASCSHASCQLCCLLKSFERNFCFRAPPCWCCFKRRASQALHGEEGCLQEVWDPLITSESTCVATSVSLVRSPPFQHSFRFHTVQPFVQNIYYICYSCFVCRWRCTSTMSQAHPAKGVAAPCHLLVCCI